MSATTKTKGPAKLPLNLLNPYKEHELEVYICFLRWHGILHPSAPIAAAMQDLSASDVIRFGGNAATPLIFPQAIASFATIFFGAQHGQFQVLNQGYAMYGAALKQLNQALTDPKCYAKDDVLLSVLALSLLEAWVPSGPKHYMKHMAGLERLLELRGPCRNPKSMAFHKGLRHMILFVSIRTRKASILARPEWKKVFRDNSGTELQEQDLFEILADSTVLTAELDDILASAEPDLQRDVKKFDELEEIAERALELLAQLGAWKDRWDSEEKDSYREVSATGDDPPPFMTIFEFSHDSTATMLLFYYSTLIHVLRILIALPRLGKDECTAAEWSATIDILRCVPYYQVRKSHLDLRVVHLAIMTVWPTLRGRETVGGRWLMDALNTPSRDAFATGLWAE